MRILEEGGWICHQNRERVSKRSTTHKTVVPISYILLDVDSGTGFSRCAALGNFL